MAAVPDRGFQRLAGFTASSRTFAIKVH